jgi:hypothetical protein
MLAAPLGAINSDAPATPGSREPRLYRDGRRVLQQFRSPKGEPAGQMLIEFTKSNGGINKCGRRFARGILAYARIAHHFHRRGIA